MNDWQPEIDEIRRRQALAQEMGGADRVARQHGRGKLTVRERITALLDADSFREWGSLAGEGRYRRTLATIYQSTVPRGVAILRRAFGVAGAGMMNHTSFHYRIAWPSGDWGSLPAEGGSEAAFKAQIEAAPDPQAARHEIAERLERLRSPFHSAERFFIEEIVAPSATRRWLCEFAELTAGLPPQPPARFHYRP